jgi:hypothetical protein
LRLDLQGQQEYRLRLMNISANNSSLRVTLRSAAGVQQWTLVSKDGAKIQDHQHIQESALNQPISVGKTYDFAWTPPATGDYWLEVDDYEDVRLTQALLRVAD